jgi:hypothetical protein
MFLAKKMRKILALACIASAMLCTAGGSAQPPNEKSKTEVFTTHEVTSFSLVDASINLVYKRNDVVIITDSNAFIALPSENVLATCKSLAAPELGLVSVIRIGDLSNKHTLNRESTNSIYKDLPLKVGWCI